MREKGKKSEEDANLELLCMCTTYTHLSPASPHSNIMLLSLYYIHHLFIYCNLCNALIQLQNNPKELISTILFILTYIYKIAQSC